MKEKPSCPLCKKTTGQNHFVDSLKGNVYDHDNINEYYKCIECNLTYPAVWSVKKREVDVQVEA